MPIRNRSFALAFVTLLGISHSAAPGQTTRSRWEYDDGFVKQARRWQERNSAAEHSFVETARNSVFIELYDSSRRFTVRLYDSKILIRGGNQEGKPAFTKFTKIKDGSWGDSRTRKQWKYAGGSLRPVNGPSVWFEMNSHGTFVLLERSRTDEYVELHDPARGYFVRLTANALLLRGGKGPTKFRKFTRLYTGRWTSAHKPAQITVAIDVRGAPAAKKWALRAKKLCELWYPIISERLSPNHRATHRKVTLVFKKMKGIANTVNPPGGSRITISADWIRKHPDDFGMVIHELTHVVQDYPPKATAKAPWLVEGIADYVRYFEYEPEKPLKVDRKKTYRDGYAAAALFLDWAERTHDRRLLVKVNARLRADTYTDEMFKQSTRRTLPQLWSQYVKQR
jgi:hypothetical protein